MKYRRVFGKSLSIALALFASLQCAVLADPAMDAGLGYFKKRDWRSAIYYFEIALKNSPWDSNTMYYLALSYHQAGFQSKAKAMYRQIVDKFPGSAVFPNALAALKVLDPVGAKAAQSDTVGSGKLTVGASTGISTGAPAAAAKKGAKPAGAQALPANSVPFKREGLKMLVSVAVNGRSTQMVFDSGASGLTMSQQQASGLGLHVPGDAEETTAQVNGGETRARTATAISVKLGPVEKSHVRVSVVDNGMRLPYPQLGHDFCSGWQFTPDEATGAIQFVRR